MNPNTHIHTFSHKDTRTHTHIFSHKDTEANRQHSLETYLNKQALIQSENQIFNGIITLTQTHTHALIGSQPQGTITRNTHGERHT